MFGVCLLARTMYREKSNLLKLNNENAPGFDWYRKCMQNFFHSAQLSNFACMILIFQRTKGGCGAHTKGAHSYAVDYEINIKNQTYFIDIALITYHENRNGNGVRENI